MPTLKKIKLRARKTTRRAKKSPSKRKIEIITISLWKKHPSWKQEV